MHREKLQNAKHSITKVEDIVQSKVNMAIAKEREMLAKLKDENELLKQRIQIFDQDKFSS